MSGSWLASIFVVSWAVLVTASLTYVLLLGVSRLYRAARYGWRRS